MEQKPRTKKSKRSSKAWRAAQKQRRKAAKLSKTTYIITDPVEDFAIMGRFCSLPYSKRDWIEVARESLIQRATRHEKIVYAKLKSEGIRFVFQAPFMVDDRIYFLDFFLPEKRMAIEVDGSYHSGITQSRRDKERDRDFEGLRIRTTRIANHEVEKPERLQTWIELVK